MIVIALEDSRMPFTAHDLRYHLESSYPALCDYLQHRAKRYLGPFAYDAYEVDVVVGHVVEQLTRLQLLGGGDHTPETALDRLSHAQFYAFLNQSVKHKAIDRLRKRRLPTSTLAELEGAGNSEEENDPLNTVTDSIWGSPPFPTPEAAALQAVSQEELRFLLKRCIEELSSAPRQLEAVMKELEEMGAGDLLQELREEHPELLADLQLAHLSQHKDHAHKKLRHCLQKNSTNLAVLVAFRLTEYGEHSAGTDEVSVDIKALAKDDLSEREVQKGLKHLVRVGLLEWYGEEIVRFSSVQLKYLARFYEEGE
jgi:DNA-directed RNA polymerase specialized sigma24 family protein